MKKLLYIVAAPTSMKSFLLPRVEWLKEDFELVCICSPGEGHEEVRAAGMRTIELPIVRRISLWQDMKSLWKLWRILRRENPDIVHSMTPKAGLLGMTAAYLAGVRIRIHTFTGLIFPWRHGFIRRVLWTTDAITCFFANVVNPEGEGVRVQLQAAGVTRKDMQIIAHGNINGVDSERFVPRWRREAKRRELGISDDEVVFAFVGRIVADKGISELVDNFCRLHAELPATRLILIGKEEQELDPLPDGVRQLLLTHPAIIYAGVQRDVEVWLAASDIFVLPSHREGFNNSLLEASVMGIPCITYDICGCNEAVTSNTGILIPPYDDKELYVAMRSLTVDSAQRAALGDLARTHVLKFFERRYVWQELRKFYTKLLCEFW